MVRGVLLSRWDCDLKQPFIGVMRSPVRCGGFVLAGRFVLVLVLVVVLESGHAE
jgi:hypothetical protein